MAKSEQSYPAQRSGAGPARRRTCWRSSVWCWESPSATCFAVPLRQSRRQPQLCSCRQ